MRVYAALCLSLLILAGCAAAPLPRAHLDQDVRYDLPANPWQGERLNAFQQLTIEFKEKTLFLQAFIALEPGRAKITLLDMSGRRALDINWQLNNIQIYRADWLPGTARAEDVLARLVLAYWPVEIARAGLPAGTRLRVRGGQRVVENTSGQVLSIVSDGEQPWTAKTVIDQPNAGFRLTISSHLKDVE